MSRRQSGQIFNVLGNPTRRVIFERLSRCANGQTAGDLARTLPVTRTNVVQHLKILERANLLTAKTEGHRRLYTLNREGLKPLRDWLAGIPANTRAAP